MLLSIHIAAGGFAMVPGAVAADRLTANSCEV